MTSPPEDDHHGPRHDEDSVCNDGFVDYAETYAGALGSPQASTDSPSSELYASEKEQMLFAKCLCPPNRLCPT